MEPIKKALERARQERARGGGTTFPGAPGRPVGGGSPPLDLGGARSWSPEPAVLRERRVFPGDDDSPGATAYKVLRTKVLQRLAARGWQAVGITSPRVGEGKTLTAVNLAMSLARDVNHTVILVDVNLREPRVHELLGLEPERGIGDVLIQGVPAGEALYRPGLERLLVLPGREAVADASEWLASPAMLELVAGLRAGRPRQVLVFDLPPLLTGDEALAFLPNLDVALLVVEQGRTLAEDVRRSVEQLGDLPLLGSVLNRARDGVVQS